MEKIKVFFKKLDERAKMPTYGSMYAAGADLYALCDGKTVIPAGKSAFIHTGLSLEIPEGIVGLVYARSGLSCRRGLAPANKVGVVDSDYRGEIMVCLYNQGESDAEIENGERIAQMVFAPYFSADFEEKEELSDTVRGEKGFGSTGTK
ncbi:MAG: dUTP diphosphatase [Eubacteriales bacterium]